MLANQQLTQAIYSKFRAKFIEKKIVFFLKLVVAYKEMVCYNQGMMKEKTNCLALALRKRNAKAEAWVAEDPDNRWAGTLTEDLAHWAEYGVTTADELERHLLVGEIWDSYKDLNGIRPRHMDLNSMSVEQLRKVAANLSLELQTENALIASDLEAEKAELEAEFKAEADAMKPAPAFTLGDSFPL